MIDLSLHFSGPFGTSMLADQGADVIKVEEPNDVESTRHMPPTRKGVSAMYTSINRNKRSIALDLRKAEGKSVLADLLLSADVLVQNFRPGVIDKLGFSYANVRKLNPGIIFVSINGFGAQGPYAERRAYDQIVQASCGIGVMQADIATGEPQLIRTAICDKVTALVVAQGITAALFARSRDGEGHGQHIEVPMLDSALWFLWPDFMANETFIGDDVQPEALNPEHFRLRKTKNGHLIVVIVTQGEFEAACRALGKPEVAQMPRFSTAKLRYENLSECNETLAPLFAVQDNEAIYAKLLAEGVPAARVNDREAVIADPQVRSLGIVEELENPIAGSYRQARHPIKFSGTSTVYRRPTPRLGENTVEILKELKYSDAQIDELTRARAVLIRANP